MYAVLKEKFPHTQITDYLPDELLLQSEQIITYRFGILSSSNMMTIEIRSYVEPGACYQFIPGSLKPSQSNEDLVCLSNTITIPKHIELQGDWTDRYSSAQSAANVLGKFSSFYTDRDKLILPVEESTADKLAYYNALLIDARQSIKIESKCCLPVTIMRVEKNYKDGYLKLPEYGGGYYLEVHDTPHLLSPLTSECSGVLLLGKKIASDRYHLSAFKIPFGTAVYIPGGVIHCDGMLIGDIMAIYTVTPDYSTVILKNHQDEVVSIELDA